MNLLLPNRTSFVCHSCRRAQIHPLASLPLSARAPLSNRATAKRSGNVILDIQPVRRRLPGTKERVADLNFRWNSTSGDRGMTAKDKIQAQRETLRQLIARSEELCQSPGAPDEEAVLDLLKRSEELAKIFTSRNDRLPPKEKAEAEAIETPTSTVLNLANTGQDRTVAFPSDRTFPTERVSQKLTTSLCNLLCDPKVYISPSILASYVHVQVLLGRPDNIPEIFHHYAHKPLPRIKQSNLPWKPMSTTTVATKTNSTSPEVTFTQTSPRNPKNAVPHSLALESLDAAIFAKSLPLALHIIDTSIAAPAFRLHKILSRAGVPLALLSLTPFCAYTTSNYIAQHYQNTYDPVTATWFGAAGIMAYLGTTITMGYAALTTYNDHMKRVVWRPGTKLRDRWLREEERAAFDRLALAWGYRERWRWGEERGEDWEALREFCARRGMILDKTNLIEGME